MAMTRFTAGAAAAALVASALLATPTTGRAQSLSGKTIDFEVIDSDGCSIAHAIRVTKDKLLYSTKSIRCGAASGSLLSGYGEVIPINGSAPIRNACSKAAAGTVVKCTDGFRSQGAAGEEYQATWTGERSGKTAADSVEIRTQRHAAGTITTPDGAKLPFDSDVNAVIKLAIKGNACTVGQYASSTSASRNLTPSRKSALSSTATLKSQVKCTVSG